MFTVTLRLPVITVPKFAVSSMALGGPPPGVQFPATLQLPAVHVPVENLRLRG